MKPLRALLLLMQLAAVANPCLALAADKASTQYEERESALKQEDKQGATTRRNKRGVTKDVLHDRAFSFYAKNEKWVKSFILNSDGSISGSDHPNETFWDIREGNLVLLHSDGKKITSIYKVVRSRKGKFYFEGEFQDDKKYILVLKEKGY